MQKDTNYIEELNNLKNKTVIIDCGHTPIQYDGTYSLGKDREPSISETDTLNIGVQMYELLRKHGKKPILNICFSDTTKFIKENTQRHQLKIKCADKSIYNSLPASYKTLLSAIPKSNLIFNLQTSNSNRFTNIIKSTKKEIKKTKNKHDIFNKYNAIFTSDHSDTLFGFSHAYLLDTTYEDGVHGGEWWKNEFSTLHPTDIIKAPITPLKKLGIINLYSRSSGVLCPATYGGLLSNFNDDTSHIAIYSREDDPDVGEKIIRGVITANTLMKERSRNRDYLQIITRPSQLNPEGASREVTYLSSAELNANRFTYFEASELFNKKLSYRYTPIP